MSEVLEEKRDGVLPGFLCRKIKISDKIEATLTYMKSDSNKAVLYIHGFADCFCNDEMAKFYKDQGYAFYALDLRGYGRSIKDEENKFYIESIDEYFDEIDRAIYHILSKHNTIVLKGFSMGGLISSTYMHRGFYREHIAALVLVSPLFRFNTNTFQDYFVKPVVLGLARFFPSLKYSVSTEKYKDHITRLFIDSENFDNKSIPLYLGWFKAMYDAIEDLEKGLNIDKPILILASNKSEKDLKKYNYDSDIFLDVADMKGRAKLLGKDVTFKKIDNAIHEVFTSRSLVKKEAYRQLYDWLKINV